MPFLKTISIDTDKVHPFPFDIAAVRSAKSIEFDSKLTIIIGENGSGKSTLLELIALRLNLPLMGGPMELNDSFEAARLLQPYLKMKMNRPIPNGFFFRIEDFSEYIHAVQKEKNRIHDSLEYLQGEVKSTVLGEMMENMNYRLRAMRKEYGNNLQTLSHGEACMVILDTKISGPGIFLMDEPENGMHPAFQLRLISMILQKIKNENAQFVISTHSPLVASIPGATLYEIQKDGIHRLEYAQTDHFQITKYYVDHPQAYNRDLTIDGPD